MSPISSIRIIFFRPWKSCRNLANKALRALVPLPSLVNLIGLKTDNIYEKSGGHYLNVLNDDKLDTNKIEFLLRKIFDQGPLEYDKRKEFIDLLQSMYSQRYKIINNIPNFNLFEVKYLVSQCVLTYVQ